MDNINNSRYLKPALLVILGLIVIIGAFRLGVEVGFRKASFSYSWGENYDRNFGPPPQGMLGRPGPGGMDFLNPHGTAGTILKIEKDTILIKGNDNIEKSVIVSDMTTIVNGRNPIKPGSLKAGENIMVIGSPGDQGQINAKFIRVFENKAIR